MNAEENQVDNSVHALSRNDLTPDEEEQIVTSVRELIKAYQTMRHSAVDNGKKVVSEWEELGDEDIDEIISNLFSWRE